VRGVPDDAAIRQAGDRPLSGVAAHRSMVFYFDALMSNVDVDPVVLIVR
jgi:hypothetical protein